MGTMHRHDSQVGAEVHSLSAWRVGQPASNPFLFNTPVTPVPVSFDTSASLCVPTLLCRTAPAAHLVPVHSPSTPYSWQCAGGSSDVMVLSPLHHTPCLPSFRNLHHITGSLNPSYANL